MKVLVVEDDPRISDVLEYVVKPFSPRELLAWIKAIRRRNDRPVAASALGASESELCYGPIRIDPEKFRIHCQGREIVLTAQEFKLLELLVRHPGRVFTRAQVLNRAWGEGGLVTDRTIDVHVKSLRKKFGKFEFIETVRGIGYRARELSMRLPGLHSIH
jgi:DNA-binding response OmpR family regulator